MIRRKRASKTGAAMGILLSLSMGLLFLANQSKEFSEWYASTIYPIFVGSIGRFFGVFPFSAAELLLYLLILVFTVSVVRWLIQVIRRIWGWKRTVSCLGSWGVFASALLLIYTLLCGINYQRFSFAVQAGMQKEPYEVRDLAELCRELTEEVNGWSRRVERNEEGIMQVDAKMQQDAVAAMEALGEIYPTLKGYYPRPKRTWNPWILSVQQLSGIYAPFTIEANYNSHMTPYNIPFTACHELAHLRGFMEEEEANFIAYLACMESESAEFRYSGNLLAWIYSMNALQKADKEQYLVLRKELSVQTERDLKENNAFWKRYEGRVAEVANSVNDTYLKANGQKEGVMSYGKMVDLLVAHYKTAEKAEWQK